MPLLEIFQCVVQVAGYGKLMAITLGEDLHYQVVRDSQGEDALVVATHGPCKYLHHPQESFS